MYSYSDWVDTASINTDLLSSHKEASSYRNTLQRNLVTMIAFVPKNVVILKKFTFIKHS